MIAGMNWWGIFGHLFPDHRELFRTLKTIIYGASEAFSPKSDCLRQNKRKILHKGSRSGAWELKLPI